MWGALRRSPNPGQPVEIGENYVERCRYIHTGQVNKNVLKRCGLVSYKTLFLVIVCIQFTETDISDFLLYPVLYPLPPPNGQISPLYKLEEIWRNGKMLISTNNTKVDDSIS